MILVGELSLWVALLMAAWTTTVVACVAMKPSMWQPMSLREDAHEFEA